MPSSPTCLRINGTLTSRLFGPHVLVGGPCSPDSVPLLAMGHIAGSVRIPGGWPHPSRRLWTGSRMALSPAAGHAEPALGHPHRPLTGDLLFVFTLPPDLYVFEGNRHPSAHNVLEAWM